MTNFELMNKAREYFKEIKKELNLEEEINLFFDAHSNRRWGQAGVNDGERYIEICLYRHIRQPGKLRDTIGHELAHHAAGLRSGHNSHWKEICISIGVNSKATHSSNPNAKPCWD